MKTDILKTMIFVFLLLSDYGFAQAEKLADFPELVNPTQILVNQVYMYIMEPPRIFIYGKSDLELIKSVGRAGEGPGEFKIQLNTNPQQFFVELQAGNLLVSQVGRISLLTALGKPLRDIPLSEGNRFRMAGGGFLGFGVASEGKTRLSTLNLYDGNLKKNPGTLPEEILDSGGRRLEHPAGFLSSCGGPGQSHLLDRSGH
jgi:hypothetical protein